VAPADFVEVRFGHSYWLKVAQTLVASLGLLAILVTPANWKWKISGTLLLVLAACLVHARSEHKSRSGAIRLFADGRALLWMDSRPEINAAQGRHGWVSRWFSILTLQEAGNGRKHFCVICASENHPDEYRRLLKFLRMHTPPTEVQRMIW
jgi:hypothetical protein